MNPGEQTLEEQIASVRARAGALAVGVGALAVGGALAVWWLRREHQRALDVLWFDLTVERYAHGRKASFDANTYELHRLADEPDSFQQIHWKQHAALMDRASKRYRESGR